MPRVGYLDCFSGIAGDMVLGALVDAGCPLDELQNTAARLALDGVTLSAEKVKRGGLAATKATVHVSSEKQRKHRHLPDVLAVIDRAKLPAPVAEHATAVFHKLAEAEAEAHGIGVEKVHFHEVGADDALVDIVGTCAGFHLLGLERIFCSPIPTGHGTVRCEHGVMPVPAPATAALLRGVPLADCEEPGELATPTGVALAVTLAEQFGPLPPMRIAATGHGAGSREGQTRPNFLRLIVGELDAAVPPAAGRVAVLEAQLDDAPGQVVAHACERLLAAGALDVFIVPIIMKKGRPGQLLTVLCRPTDAGALEQLVLRETTTFGVRRHDCERAVLSREHVSVATPFGDVRVKVGRAADETVQAWPEYDDCAAAAKRHNVPLRRVQQAAIQAWLARDDAGGVNHT